MNFTISKLVLSDHIYSYLFAPFEIARNLINPYFKPSFVYKFTRLLEFP